MSPILNCLLQKEPSSTSHLSLRTWSHHLNKRHMAIICPLIFYGVKVLPKMPTYWRRDDVCVSSVWFCGPPAYCALHLISSGASRCGLWHFATIWLLTQGGEAFTVWYTSRILFQSQGRKVWPTERMMAGRIWDSAAVTKSWNEYIFDEGSKGGTHHVWLTAVPKCLRNDLHFVSFMERICSGIFVVTVFL